MPIRNVTPKGSVNNALAQYMERVRRVLIRNLAYIGEQVVNEGRTRANFIDRTGNLRSSIGYVIVEDGKIVSESSFEPVKGGEEGARKGRAFAESLAKKHNKDLVLIVVAGENYARYVANKGYDVIDSAELLAQKLVPEMLRQLKLI